MLNRSFSKIGGSAAPEVWVGANFWSRGGGPRMWRSYDGALVREELAVLKEHGMPLTRSFFFWPDFMPSPDRIDEECVAHYQDFLSAHTELGMRTIPTFIIGHMSGQNWDPSWRDGRDLYADVWMVGRQAWFIEQMTRRLRDHPAIAGWLVSNEMPLYGGDGDQEQVGTWAQLMVQAIRSAGATQPVSLGDGTWGVEVTGRDNGFSVRHSAALADWLGPHVYRMDNDQVRQYLTPAFLCELATTFGTPVVLEEFGLSSDFVSPTNAAHYYRQVLHTSLLAGVTGWIAWNNTDYDALADSEPYQHHPFEMHFGLTDADGTPKPQMKEMASFAELLGTIDLAGCHRPDADTALVISSYLEADYPFTEPEDRDLIFDATRQSYIAAREADLPLALVRESDGITSGAGLYLLPSTKQLTTTAGKRLEELAEEGATVYVSYCAGTHDLQRGPWYPNLNQMFGVEQQLSYGLAQPIENDTVEVTFRTTLGSLPRGAQLTFRAAGTANSRSYLPVVPTDAEVLAVDQHDRPFLLRRRLGTGQLLLCTYPIEHMAAVTPMINPEPTARLYDALATEAAVHRPVTVEDPAVGVDVLDHADGRRFVFAINYSGQEMSAKPAVAAPGVRLLTLDGRRTVDTLALPPYGVQVCLLSERTAE